MSAQTTEDFDRSIRLHIYRHHVETGRPPTAAETAEALSTTADEVEAAYRRLAEGHVIVLSPGTLDILMSNPLSAIPTPFRVEIGERSWYGNCIWDALGVVAMLGGTGRVVAACGQSGEPMTLIVEKGELLTASGVIHFALPAARWWDNIIFT